MAILLRLHNAARNVSGFSLIFPLVQASCKSNASQYLFSRPKVQDLISLHNICTASLMKSIDCSFQAISSAHRSTEKDFKDSFFRVDEQNSIPSPSFCIRNDFTWLLCIWLEWIILLIFSLTPLNIKPIPLMRGLVSVTLQPCPRPDNYYVQSLDFITITPIIRIINALSFLFVLSHACTMVI